jgi:D-alanyl-D-alanine carboxypeptidase/D-alanyl-D-alanine-endopeptidase (penicillin-binding protein 4)
MGNEYEITFSRSNTTGQLAEIIQVNPLPPGLELSSEVRIGEKGSGDQAFVFGGPFSDQQIIRGTIPPGKTPFVIRAAVNSPAVLAADLLVNDLAEHGIQIESGYRIIQSEMDLPDQMLSKLLWTHVSPPLELIVDFLLQKSHNLSSEALLKKMSLHEGYILRTNEAAGLLADHWKQEIPEAEKWRLYDGSGLSPMNRITPLQMTRFLEYQFKVDDFLKWLNMIPQGNEISGAGRYLDDFNCLIHLHLKTGSISNVHNYAGYLKTKSGKMLGITAFFSDYDCSRGGISRSFFDLIIRLYEET